MIFKREISSFLARVKNAKYKGVELNFEEKLEDLKNETGKAGIIIDYGQQSLVAESISEIGNTPEWAIIKSWQEIENLVLNLYSNVSDVTELRPNFSRALRSLRQHDTIDEDMEALIRKLREFRNMVVHGSRVSLTRGETIEVLSIATSVKSRLEQKLTL